MHELTIANSLVELACDYARRNGALRVSSITIRLGVLCGLSRALYFCFEPASRGTRCEGASLTIIESPVRVFCENCNETKTPRTLYNLRCPDCGRPTLRVLSGREMDLVAIEVQDGVSSQFPDASPARAPQTRSTTGTTP
jgi:hydrogenase nickel incorporation protein HypA/HybF